MNNENRVESIESSEDFNSNIEKGISEALFLLKERYEDQPDEKNNLPFHNVEHTKGVIRRTEIILKTIQKADSNLVSDHDIQIGRLASAYHDTVQQWEGNEVAEGEFTKVLRKRFVGKNEEASSNEAVSFMVKANENEVIFSNEDKATVQRAINATVPGWDMENKTVMQPNLKENSSLVERALALSDLATAGMGGNQKSIEESKTLFREENLDVIEAIHSGDAISDDKKEYFRRRMVKWLKGEPNFIVGRKARLETELKAIPEQARKAVEDLFNKFDESIEERKKAADKSEEMTFEELVKYMGY